MKLADKLGVSLSASLSGKFVRLIALLVNSIAIRKRLAPQERGSHDEGVA